MWNLEINEKTFILLIEPMRETSAMPRPSLASLEAFLAVTRHGSFRGAAVERGVSASALSHVIRGLEDTLDVRLFNRTSRSVRLTEAGRHLVERVGPALGDIGDAIESVGSFRGRPSGLLRLNVPRIANELIIQPMVGRFLAAYPEVRLEVVSFDGLVDIVADGFDAGIRRDRRLAPGIIAAPVGPARRFAVVAAPSYLAGRSPIRVPQDLHAHACIERRFPDGSRYGWEFARDGEELDVEVSGPLIVDDTALMIRAALDGVGVAFMFESFVADHLAGGGLVRLLDDWCPATARFFLYHSGRRQIPASLRAFMDMVRGDPRPSMQP